MGSPVNEKPEAQIQGLDAIASGDVRRRRIVQIGLQLGLFLSLLGIYACFHQSRDWNSATRLLLTYALTQNGSIEITPFVTRDGQLMRDPPTRDLSSPGDGRYFCDKAPGQSVLGVPVYWLLLKVGLVEPYPSGLPVRPYWPSDYWVTLGTNGVCTAWTACLIFGLLVHLKVRPAWALLAGQAWGIASIGMPYATLYYGHTACGCFSLLSVYLLARWPGCIGAASLAGLCAAIAVSIDYPQAVLVVVTLPVLVICGFLKDHPIGRWNWLGYLAGGLPIALLLGYYHYLVTGSPFRVPYTMEVEEIFAYHREGMGIPIGLPKPAILMELMIGSKRGLLWYSPVVFGALPGIFWMLWRGIGWLAWICFGTFAGLCCINAGFPTWDGGWAVGPRFLLASFPLLLLATGFWLNSTWTAQAAQRANQVGKAAWLAAAGMSVIVLSGFTAVGGRVPPNIERPISEYLLPAMKQRPAPANGLVTLWQAIAGPLASYLPIWCVVCVLIFVTQGALLWISTRKAIRERL